MTRTDIKVQRGPSGAAPTPVADPIRSLRQQIDRLFADFAWPDMRLAWPDTALALPDLGIASPPVDLVERNGGYELQVELPGLTEDQIEVKLSSGMLTIKGEKASERVEENQGYHLRERSFGSFQRSFRLPETVDADKISAQFDKGVLKVTMPKSPAAIQKERKIEVKAA
ncbi:MAG: Hsp20/alpha crystallin family protein [Tabrizicola sp.]|uniref:Hsp20/alpha crystallin family protein n=1 Tax=Tabrizicola sp. TaxID=2005166 RepID=UPI002733EC22|nr:Hsp20/alpha crystallin family protein [Tabrizicola sp.]MDP3263605.1 Hsp20/alpha crystallin family protein [Tabrizicola sp.]MDP3646969.1 Hsp20/alpha crystallin family protein [Paracoccaceae bacterium]MDZ4069421.1 Hsp20/alpha crystallin family protein [Tabrizicola sp.]